MDRITQQYKSGLHPIEPLIVAHVLYRLLELWQKSGKE